MKKQEEEQGMELEIQEKELNEKWVELNELRKEESQVESKLNLSKTQLDALTSSLQSSTLQISEIIIDQIQEQHRLMSEAIKDMDNAVSFGDFRNISDFTYNGFSTPNDDIAYISPTIPKTFDEVEPAVNYTCQWFSGIAIQEYIVLFYGSFC